MHKRFSVLLLAAALFAFAQQLVFAPPVNADYEGCNGTFKTEPFDDSRPAHTNIAGSNFVNGNSVLYIELRGCDDSLDNGLAYYWSGDKEGNDLFFTTLGPGPMTVPEPIGINIDEINTRSGTSSIIRGARIDQFDVTLTISGAEVARQYYENDVIEEAGEATETEEEQEQTCSSNAGALGWILCPFVEFMEGAINELAGNALSSLLFVDVGGEQIGDAWSSVQTLANSLFVVVFLAVIFMQAFGFGDAYAIKKLLPRLVAGVILTQISLPIMRVLVDISNVLGAGIADLVLNAAGASDTTVEFNIFGENAGVDADVGGAFALGVGALATASAAASILALAITSLGTILITILVVVLVLTAREFAIIVMVVFAPIAFVSWILPNTERLFKEWMDNFIKLLLMFPLIMALIALGPMVSRIMGATGSSGNAFDILLQVAAYVVPYAAIPFTFRFAGRVFGSLAAITRQAGSRFGGGFGGTATAGGKGGGSKYQQKKAQIESGGLFKSNKGRRGAVNRGLAKASATNPLKPSSYRPSQYRAAVAEKMKSQGAAAAESDSTFNANAQDENYLALLAADPADRKKAYEELKAEHGQDVADRAMGNVRNTENDGVALRQRALAQLATTGRHFESGEDGYHQMAEMAAGIAGGSYDRASGQFSGGDSALYASTMNEAQAMAGRAGRWDLAGTNNGSGYKFNDGWKKASLYQLANGKKHSVTAARSRAAKLYRNGKHGEAAKIWHELDAMHNNSTGEVANEIRNTLGNSGKYTDTYYDDSGQEQAIDVQAVMEEHSAASVGARKYERPDPSELDSDGEDSAAPDGPPAP